MALAPHRTAGGDYSTGSPTPLVANSRVRTADGLTPFATTYCTRSLHAVGCMAGLGRRPRLRQQRLPSRRTAGPGPTGRRAGAGRDSVPSAALVADAGQHVHERHELLGHLPERRPRTPPRRRRQGEITRKWPERPARCSSPHPRGDSRGCRKRSPPGTTSGRRRGAALRVARSLLASQRARASRTPSGLVVKAAGGRRSAATSVASRLTT